MKHIDFLGCELPDYVVDALEPADFSLDDEYMVWENGTIVKSSDPTIELGEIDESYIPMLKKWYDDINFDPDDYEEVV